MLQLKKHILAWTYYIGCLYNRCNKYPYTLVILATDVIGVFLNLTFTLLLLFIFPCAIELLLLALSFYCLFSLFSPIFGSFIGSLYPFCSIFIFDVCDLFNLFLH